MYGGRDNRERHESDAGEREGKDKWRWKTGKEKPREINRGSAGGNACKIMHYNNILLFAGTK